MMPRLLAALLLLTPAAAAQDTLLTRAEATEYRATSTYADVMAFVEKVAERPDFHLTTFGETVEGRALPLVIRGEEAAPEAVRASGKLRVLVFANIHAGEVAGKEAVLMLLRALAAGEHAAWADSLTLLLAPIYNADGNERLDPGNRPFQHGPVDGMGTRANAQGLDLNRDFVKLDAPESRALVGLFNDYDPHVIVDLHTTNGTIHGYHLTYAPPLHPSTPAAIDSLLRNHWLPDVTGSYKQKYGWDLTYYGNDKPEWGQPSGWATFDPRPRFGTNYAGLRNRVGILSEAYSYATFEDRVLASLRFVVEVLDWAHAHASDVLRAVHAAEAEPVVGEQLAMRTAGRWVEDENPPPVLLGEVVEEANPHTGQPMYRRTDAQTPTEMPALGRFEAGEPVAVPAAYLVPADQEGAVERLRWHGVEMEPLTGDAVVEVEAFEVDSVRTAGRAFQNRYEQELFGRYIGAIVTVPAGTLVVPVEQPLGRLAAILLEPRSDSGLAGWGVIGAAPGLAYPVYRVPDPAVARRLLGAG